MMCFLSVFYLAILIFSLVCTCKVAKKMGYPWAYGLFTLIPFFNFYVMYHVAFKTWPIEEQLMRLQAGVGRPPAGGQWNLPPSSPRGPQGPVRPQGVPPQGPVPPQGQA